MPPPLILLDDARTQGAGEARLYRAPTEVVVAHRPEQVAPALARLEELSRSGLHLAGYLAYEAGLALEPKLAGLAAGRSGATGPLLWFGGFAGCERIAPPDVPARLMEMVSCADAAIGPLEPQLSPGEYAAAFDALKAAIEAGDIYQANLTIPLIGSWRGDPLALYAALRPRAAAGHGGVLHDGTDWLLSFSPELFFNLKDGIATARPMKGTRPRGRDATEDCALIADLAASAKDRAENLMILDLMRNDLSRVAEPGSVRVGDAFTIETYPTVHQMVSTVRARLRPGLGAIDLLRALFPCGSITGAPKIRAMELIAGVERHIRGPYCGAIGRIDPAEPNGTGEAAFNVAIRTLRLVGNRNGAARAVLGVGSAIVAQSDAMGEWRECLVKGGFLRDATGRASETATDAAAAASFDLIETMHYMPRADIPLLELHLDRMAASARELGFALDRPALDSAVTALCAGRDQPGKLRLCASRSGAWTLELTDMPPPLADPVPCAVLRLPVDASDWRLRHKTSDRGFYEGALRVAHQAGAAEALFLRDDGLVTEGCFTTIFVERDGMLLTPPVRLGLLPGVLRRSLIDAGRAVEAELRLDDLGDGFLIGNALRGLLPASVSS